MKIIDRSGPAFAAFVGAFVAGFAILASEPNDTIALEGDGGIWLHTTLQWAATAAAVTAVLVYMALRARASAAATVSATIAGAGVLTLPAWMDVTTAQSVSFAGLGAGSLLGVSAFLVADRAAVRVAPAVGLVAALLFTPAVDALRGSPDRWLLSSDAFYPPAVVPVPALLITAVLIAVVALRCAPTGTPPPGRHLPAVGAALPVLFLVVCAAVGSTMPDCSRWLIGVAVVVAATLAATRLLSVPDAVLLMVGLAIAAAVVSDLGWYRRSNGAVWLALGVVLLAVGVWFGRRRPAPVAALTAFLAVTATGLLPGDATAAVIAYAVVLPFAAGYGFGSCRPLQPEIVLTAGMLPFTLALLSVYVPVAEPDFGWTAVWPPVAAQSGLNADPVPVAVAVAVGLAATATAAGVTARRRSAVRS
ncbi:hypothetical protein [Prescottella equi]|uniref:hypothetical protein n=1 Tax=Rhodococcus hoagii TaxID=43767 RepID=UPI000A11D919|nr:hypothetical protein [Prescottella equi]ORL99398.1 hypothetical protein A5N72_21270 [Prescottella equi]